MNIQQLRTFVAVVESGSFSAAARGLEISQPAVTMQVRSLESELGSVLLERRYRRIELTEAGAALLPVARRVLGELDAVRDEIAAAEGQITGHLVVAASTTPGVYVIPRLLGGFVAEHPAVRLTLLVSDSAEVVERVRAGEAGLGVTGAEVKGSGVEFEQIGFDDLVVIAPPASPLQGERVRLDALATQRFVTRERGSGTRQATEAHLARAGLDPAALDVAFELGAGEAVLSAVEGGLGIAIVSQLVAQRALALGSVVQVDVEGFPAPRPLYAVTPRGGPSRPARAFLEHLRKSIVRA